MRVDKADWQPSCGHKGTKGRLRQWPGAVPVIKTAFSRRVSHSVYWKRKTLMVGRYLWYECVYSAIITTAFMSNKQILELAESRLTYVM